MKRLLASLALIVAATTLSGCYYDPGYSYVRSSGYSGDAYYGRGGSDYVVPGYYDGYYGSGYYGGYGYAPGVSVWYSDSHYRHDGYRYRGRRDYRGHEGHWRGHGDAGGHRREHGGDYRGHQGHGNGRPSSGDRRHDSDRRGRGDRDHRRRQD
jgi:hypothetical protein